MACFCHETTAMLLAQAGLAASAGASLGVEAGLTASAAAGLSATASLGLQAAVLPVDPLAALVAEAATWLAARWLPAPAPWRPDPAWLTLALPAPPMPAASLAVVLGLVQARLDCIAAFGLDPALPAAAPGLARLVATLNARLPSLAILATDTRPWAALAALNAQADLVLSLGAAGAAALFGPPALPGLASPAVPPAVPLPSLAPWRSLIAQVKALAPLLAIAGLLKLDLASPGFAAALSAQMRVLARLDLPPLADAMLLLQVTAQLSAVARLQASFGADPRLRPFALVQAAVTRKVALAAALLPRPFLPPPHLPNPAALVTAEVMALLAALTPEMLAPLAWSVPARASLPLLTVAAPAAAFAAQASLLGAATVRASPCGRQCDAALLARGHATASPGSGRRAAPAG